MYCLSNKNSIKKSSLSPGKQGLSVYKISGKYEPTGVMSRIYNSKNSANSSLVKNNFFNLETHKVSALVPELRFFKDQEGTLTPFYLPITNITTDATSLINPSRVGAAAVKSFSVDYTGTDPFQAPRYLDASLQLYVDNLQNIFAPPPEPGYARLADLFTISIANPLSVDGGDGNGVLSTDMARPIEIAATLGYSIINRDIFTQEEIQEILESNISLRMNVYSHQINIEQNGTATIDIKYTARIDNAGKDKIFSALDSPADLLARADLKRLFNTKEEEISSIKRIERKDVLETKMKKQEAKLAECRQILESLGEKKIYSVKASKPDLFNYSNLGLNPSSQKALDNAIKSTIKQHKDILKPDGVNLSLGANQTGLSTSLFSDGQSSRTGASLLDGSTAVPSYLDADTSLTMAEPPKDELLNRNGNNLLKKLNEVDSSEREVYYIMFGDLVEAFVSKVRNSLARAKALVDAASSGSSSTSRAAKAALESAGIGSFLKKTESEKKEIKKVLDGAVKKMKTFKILLSDVVYKGFDSAGEKGGVTKRVNIGDIPISLYTYQKFMYDMVINSDRNTYVIPQFLQSCIAQGGLLHKAFAEWAQAGIAPNIVSDFPEFTSAVFSGPQLRSSIGKNQFVSPESINPQKNFVASNIEDESDYFIIYQSPTRELTSDKSGDKKTDDKRGIYHFEIGKNRGLLKNVSFSRIDVPFVQEQLMTNQVGMYDELKMIYNANIEMVGNNLFFPGSQIFIDPGTIGFGNPRDIDSAAYRLGLGGYYTVLGVSPRINNGIATTTLNTSFEARAGKVDVETNENLPPSISQMITEKKTSPDSEPKEMPSLRAEPLEYYGLYYDRLLALRHPETNKVVVSSDIARALSEDFQRLPSQRPRRLKGVYDRQKGPEGDTVIYHLTNGVSIKMERKSGKDSVSVVKNFNTFPAN